MYIFHCYEQQGRKVIKIWRKIVLYQKFIVYVVYDRTMVAKELTK